MNSVEMLASGTRSTLSRAATSVADAVAGFAGRFSKALLRLDGMLEKHRSRRALLELTDEQLKDIGVSRADAYREAARPFWN